jgi:hypothetical protein
MRFRPPFCPNKHCTHHLDPDTPEGKALRRVKWFAPFGWYDTKIRGPVPRFRCRHCGRTFSRQTFRLDYYVKRAVDYDQLRDRLTSCSSVRAVGKSLKISPDSVSNRISRLSRQYTSACAMLLSVLVAEEAVVADGFESFAVSQFFPNNITLLGGADSQYVLFADYATLRRKGRMTKWQKHLREQLEKLYRADPGAVKASFTRLLDTVADLASRTEQRPFCLRTDKKHDYRRALAGHRTLAAAQRAGTFTHATFDSKAARTTSNPLFTVNYLDRQLRKDLAEHVRETTRFARNVCLSMERLWVTIGHYNFYKRYRITDPVCVERTHAEEAALSREQVAHALHQITTVRRFLSFQRLPPALEQCWRRGYETPLRTLKPEVMRALKKAARKGEVDIEELKKSLDLDSLTHDKPQYLPKYALN